MRTRTPMTLDSASSSDRRGVLHRLLGASLGLLGPAGATAGQALAQSGAATGDAEAYKGDFTYWLWGEGDLPGMDNWMASRVAEYTKLHPEVSINIVSQSTDTLTGAFRLAAQGRSGPDIATQWATLPTLTAYWNGSAVAISDYIPASETDNWINTSENTVDGKIISMPLYLIGVPLVWNKDMFRQAGLDPDKAPETWSDFLEACAALKAEGLTPFGMGNKDGYFGAWMFSIFAKQELDSLEQLKSAFADTGSFNMDQLGGVLLKLYTMMQELVQKGYLNTDVASLDLAQGSQLFPQKKAAMALNTDSVVMSWGRILGSDAIGVARPPRWGTGELAKTYNVTQSSGAFITSWAEAKLAAATFLAWLHQPENLVSLAQIGAFPADKRFPIETISDPLAQRLLGLASGSEFDLARELRPAADRWRRGSACRSVDPVELGDARAGGRNLGPCREAVAQAAAGRVRAVPEVGGCRPLEPDGGRFDGVGVHGEGARRERVGQGEVAHAKAMARARVELRLYATGTDRHRPDLRLPAGQRDPVQLPGRVARQPDRCGLRQLRLVMGRSCLRPLST